METTQFGINLTKFRKLRNLTQEELATQLNVSAQAISKWENGSYPDGALLPKISKCLNVSLDVLYGLKPPEDLDDKILDKSVIEKLRKLPEEERVHRIMEICYQIIYSYCSYSEEYNGIPNKLDVETVGEVKTDNVLARMRLNEDLQYFWVLRIPEEGVNNYVKIDSEILELFDLLSQEDYLKVIYYLASSKRNFMLTKKKLVKILKIDEQRISDIIDTLDGIGMVWKVEIETDDRKEEVYGYTHNSAFAMLMASARAYIEYGEYRLPGYENWTQGAFRAKNMDFAYEGRKVGRRDKKKEERIRKQGI